MYDIDQIIDQVRATIAEHLYVPVESVAGLTALTGDLGADSLDVVEICITLESLFDIEIEPDQARRFRTVFDIACFLRKRAASSACQMAAQHPGRRQAEARPADRGEFPRTRRGFP